MPPLACEPSRTDRAALGLTSPRPLPARYVKLLELEETFPLPVLLERCAESGVTVHEMDGGRYVLKGRNRKVAQPGSTSAQGLGTPSGTPPN